MRTIHLGATAFICGFCVMGLEILGFRIFGPTFGYSSYVWGSLIGIILAALSIGYVVGGRLADRKPHARLLFKLILVAGAYLFLMLLAYRKVLDFSFVKFGTVWGAFVATIVIFGPSMILLSMVSPFVIRLLTVQQKAGSIAGGIYGLSNAGSILGTFTTSFGLIWLLGSHLTFLLFASIVLLVGLSGLIPFSPKWTATVVVAATVPFSFPRAEKNLLLRRESFYNDIRVLEREDGKKSLSVNRWTSYSVSVDEKNDYLAEGSYYDYFNAAALLTEPKEILILGMGAGTSVKQYLNFFPEAHIDAVEIDPEIIRIAKDEKYFGVKEGPRVRIYAEDARPYLRRTKKKYDVVELDMFQGGPYVPFYVTTKEFYRLIADHLLPNGVVTMNVLSLRGDHTLLCSIKKTLKTAFPTVFAVQVKMRSGTGRAMRVEKTSNYILVALSRKIPEESVPSEVRKTLRAKRGYPPALSKVINNFINDIVFLPESDEASVFTDDKSDVERVTFKMVDSYVRQIPLKR